MSDQARPRSADELLARFEEWRQRHPSLTGIPLDEWWSQRVELGLVAHNNPSWTVTNYRFRTINPDTTAANAAFDASDPAINTAITGFDVNSNRPLRIRFEIDETAGGSANNITYTLEYRLNGGVWTAVTTGTNVVRMFDGSGFTNGDATTNLISGSARAFLAGSANDTSGTSAGISWTGTQHTEMDYLVELVSADLSDIDQVEFRVTSNGSPLTNLATPPKVSVTKTNPVTSQFAYRFRDHANASVALSSTSWGVNQNTGYIADYTRRLRLRIGIEETAGGSFSQTVKLQYRINGGAWSDVQVNAPGQSDDIRTAIAAVEIVENSGYTEGDSITTGQLTGSSQTWQNGTARDTTISHTVTGLSSEYTELEWSLWFHEFNTNGVRLFSDGDTIDFRVVTSAGGTLTTYTQTPTITVNKPAGHVGGTWSESPDRQGPWKDSNGNLYMLTEITELDPRPQMWKSTDGGDTWAPVDYAGRPASGDLESVSAKLTTAGTGVHIVGYMGSEIVYNRFNFSDHGTPDDWAEIDTVVTSGLTQTEQSVLLGVKANDDLVVAYNSGDTIVFYRRESAIWTGPTSLWTGDTFYGVTGELNPNDDRLYCFTINATDARLEGKVITDGGAIEDLFGASTTAAATGTQVDTNVGTSAGDRINLVPPVLWGGASPECVIGWRGNDDDDFNAVNITLGSGGSVGTIQTLNASGGLQYNLGSSRMPVAALVRDPSSGDIYAFWSQFVTANAEDIPTILYATSTDDGASWGTPATFTTRAWGGRINWIRAEIVGTAIGVMYESATRYEQDTDTTLATNGGYLSGFVWYDELALSAGPKTGTGAGSLAVTGGDASTKVTRKTTAEGSLAVTGGDATGQRTTSGTAEGAVTITGGDASAAVTRSGTAEGALTVTGGDATGQRTATTSAEGALTVTGGDATGQRTANATAEGALAVSGGDAATQVTRVASAEGAVTVTGGSATGSKTGLQTGTGEGSLAVVGGDAATKVTRKTTAEGALTVTGGSATGVKQGTKAGTGEGALSVTGGDATGQRTAITTAEGALAVTGGDATGQRTTSTTAEGALAVTGGDATGQRTAITSAEGSLAVVGGDAATKATRKTTAEGAVTVTGGSAVGAKQGTKAGAGEGSLAVTGGDASTKVTHKRTAEGTVTVTGGDATGQRTGVATAEGAVVLTGGDASTVVTHMTTAEGSIAIGDGNAAGTKAGNKAGTAQGALTVTGGDATGQRTAITSAEGAVTISGGDATAQTTVVATGEASITISGGDAVGQVTRVATAEGSVTILGGDAVTQRTAVGVGSASITVTGGTAVSRSDTSNFNFDATLEQPYVAERPRSRWVTGGVHR